jgi:hypothetical protein
MLLLELETGFLKQKKKQSNQIGNADSNKPKSLLISLIKLTY